MAVHSNLAQALADETRLIAAGFFDPDVHHPAESGKGISGIIAA